MKKILGRLDKLARERTRLANERTMLSHLRTSFASLILGIGILKLFDSSIMFLGYLALLSGAFFLILAFVLYFRRLSIIAKI